MQKITDELIMNLIPERREESHKGDFGRVLVIAGSPMMTGACILCARAALRSGAGLVYAMVPREIMPQIQVAVPEVIALSSSPWPRSSLPPYGHPLPAPC